MTQHQQMVRFVSWATFLFITLGIYSSCDRKLAVSVGCQLSPAFAQMIAAGKKSADEQMAKDPVGMKRVGRQMILARYTARGIAAIILAGIIVWFRRDSGGMPNPEGWIAAERAQ